MVIQRWQSVLLLVAAVAMATFSFLSLGQIQLSDYTLNFTTLGFYNRDGSINCKSLHYGFVCYNRNNS
jgi:hypothetical protein